MLINCDFAIGEKIFCRLLITVSHKSLIMAYLSFSRLLALVRLLSNRIYCSIYPQTCFFAIVSPKIGRPLLKFQKLYRGSSVPLIALRILLRRSGVIRGAAAPGAGPEGDAHGQFAIKKKKKTGRTIGARRGANGAMAPPLALAFL